MQSDVNSHHRASLGVRLTRSLARLAIPTRAKFPGDGFLGLATVALVGSVVVAFLSINQSSQVASTGFDIRELDNTRTRLEREEQRLASEGAQLRAFGRIETEAATRLGMVPAPSPEYVRARRSPLDIDARLREAEKRIEGGRDQFYQSGEAVSRAQGELYAANAEVSRLEQSLDYLRTSRQRVESQAAARVKPRPAAT